MARGTDGQPNGQRKVVLEWQTLARIPIAATNDRNNKLIPADLDVDDLGKGLAGEFPRVQARLVMPRDEKGQLAPVERVYDVHYALLGLAAMSDYEEIRVPFTAYGLAKEMGWTFGGRQSRLIRRCVNHLYGSTLEFEGVLPDVVSGEGTEGTLSMRIINTRWFPKRENNKSAGRNASWVSYNPDYLQTLVADNPGVRIDVEMMSQMVGGLSKAHYRYLSYLRSIGENRVQVETAFEAAGAKRERTYPSDAREAFASCYEVMEKYQHITGPPTDEKDEAGNNLLVFDWGDPVQLPSRADVFFDQMLSLGFRSEDAARMIQENQRRVGQLLLAVRIGAIGEVKSNLPGYLRTLFRDPDWRLPVPEDLEPEQLDLLEEGEPFQYRAEPLMDRIRSEPDPAVRARLLGILKRVHGIRPDQVGYTQDGQPAG